MELPELYAVVPAAEEEDLLEQVARERADAPLQQEGEEPVAPPEEPEAPPADPGYPLPQVLGLLEHALGAHVLPGEPAGEAQRAPTSDEGRMDGAAGAGPSSP